MIEDIRDLIEKIIILCLSFLVLSLVLTTKNLEKKINELEENNKQVHEYILNRIGG